MAVLISAAVVLLLLLVNEWWWRRQRKHNELNRKFVHITVGSFIACWPFFMSWQQIRWLSLAFILAIAISRYLGVFNSIHSVQRTTWGEFFFAAAVGALTFVTNDTWIYLAATLQMALADGLAAVVGVTYGAKQRYRVLGQTKSVSGTVTFFFASLYILIAYTFLSATPIPLAVLLGVSSVAAVIENFGVYGLDNLLVPVAVAVALQLLGH